MTRGEINCHIRINYLSSNRFSKLIQNLKCYFGIHKWDNDINEKRECICCGTYQKYVTDYCGMDQTWITFPNTLTFQYKKKSCLKK